MSGPEWVEESRQNAYKAVKWMAGPLIDRENYDHPEHFDDRVREYRSSDRYRPTPLEHLLFELAGHRCTICNAPWLEIHHIEGLGEGGQTEYDNLIVLCPNCHTRIHSEGVPSKAELRHYKLKQEIAYELPIIDRLSEDERDFVQEVSSCPLDEQVVWSIRKHYEIEESDYDQAIREARKRFGLLYLQESGIVIVDLELACVLASRTGVSVTLRGRLTSKGIKWVRYLKETGRVPGS